MADIYYIPSGPKNLSNLFPTINWNQVDDYFLEVLSAGTVIATTPLMIMGCCCSDEDIIVHFLNSCGAFDQIAFQQPTITHDTKSSQYFKSLNYPLSKQDYGWSRFNINAVDTYESSNTCLEEDDMSWVQELFDSPFALLQWDGIESQPDDFIPINILDGSFVRQNSDAGFATNKVTIKFKISNDYITQRN